MMKVSILLVLGVVLAMVSSFPTFPAEEESNIPVAVYQEESMEESGGVRYKRATCDVGSFSSKWFTPNHSLCAVHCLTKGYKGGNCKKTICHCRN